MRKIAIGLGLLALVALVYTATAHPVGWNGHWYGMPKGIMGYGMPMIGYGYAPYYDYQNNQNAGNNTGFNGDFYNWHCPMWRWFNQNAKTNYEWYCPMWEWINQNPEGS